MPQGLVRFQESGQTHFVTFSCVGRQPNFTSAVIYNLFLETLERTRLRFAVRIYGYVVMPEHVHLLVSEPKNALLYDALHYLKQSFTQRVHSVSMKTGAFWEKRYYDRNVRDEEEFKIKLRYLHRNPVKRGLEVEQLPPLCVAGGWSRRNRVGMDSLGPRGAGTRQTSANIPRASVAAKSDHNSDHNSVPQVSGAQAPITWDGGPPTSKTSASRVIPARLERASRPGYRRTRR